MLSKVNKEVTLFSDKPASSWCYCPTAACSLPWPRPDKNSRPRFLRECYSHNSLLLFAKVTQCPRQTYAGQYHNIVHKYTVCDVVYLPFSNLFNYVASNRGGKNACREKNKVGDRFPLCAPDCK